jgi:dihydroorotate dehydrogenase electron transfer subunit
MDTPCQIVSKIDSIEKITDDIVRLTVIAPDIANTAVPGQFVMVRLGKELDPLLRRPFSIHRVKDNGSLQILFKVVGKGTRLLSSMKKGQFLDIVGPLGKGFKVGKGGKCIVGGGMGIAPLLFLAQSLLKTDSPASITIMLGARTKSEIEKLESDFTKLGLNVQVATDDGSYGHHGFVTDFLLQELDQKGKGVTVLSCGPHLMLKKVATMCKEHNVECQVSLETMMACGISACLGCAIKKATTKKELSYLHVCKDGPVFNVGDFVWE